VRLFLDTSVLLAACASATGASREVIRLAPGAGWKIIATPYVLGETEQNLGDFGKSAALYWQSIKGALNVRADVLTLDRPVVFSPAKDRPILFGAVAWADVLLTLDRRDFAPLIGRRFYGLPIVTPGMFIRWHRSR
jgi:predicted nucleic acid-binding protein